MKTEFLKELLADLPEDKQKDAIDKIHAENGKDVNAAKADKAALDAAVKERDTLKSQIAERDKQLEDLKANTGDAEKLKAQISELQEKHKTAAAELEAEREKHKSELSGIEFSSFIDAALTKAGAVNPKAVKALLDLDALKASQDRTSDLEAALTALKESDKNQFASGEPKDTGTAPTKGEGGADTADAAIRSIMGLKSTDKGD